MEYTVKVSRQVWQEATVHVQAEDEDEAREKVAACELDIAWDEVSTDVLHFDRVERGASIRPAWDRTDAELIESGLEPRCQRDPREPWA